MSNHTPQLRSLYRAVLRELPSRRGANGQSILSNPSSLQKHVRTSFSARNTATGDTLARIREAEQFVQYIQAQRNYVTLIERYNPGMNLTEEERVRLSARRIGMNLPAEFVAGKGDK